MNKEFVLPENWCVKGTNENSAVLREYFIQFDIVNMDWDYHYGFFFLQDGECKYSSNVWKPYVLITFEQFKQYVLKSEPVPTKKKKENYSYLTKFLKKLNIK